MKLETEKAEIAMTPTQQSGRKFSRKENKRLRGLFDFSGKPSVNRGMELKTPRYMQTQHRPEEETAPFLYNESGTLEFLEKCFPGLKTKDPEAVHQAKFWYAVIYHYFRQGWSDRRIEEERGFAFVGRVGYTVQQIRRKIKGLRRNGKPYSTRKRGRPRKQSIDEVIRDSSGFKTDEMEKWLEHIFGEESLGRNHDSKKMSLTGIPQAPE